MLILLDIDGVMVPASNWKVPELLTDGFPAFSTRAVHGLDKIVAATGAGILLTTSHKSLYSTEDWKAIFLRRGSNSFISKLPDAGKLQSRKEEILDWFKTHLAEQPFVIIDDDKSLNDLPLPLKSKLILTSALVGLTDELADKAIEVLNLFSTVQEY